MQLAMADDGETAFESLSISSNAKEGMEIFIRLVDYGVRLSRLTRERPEDIEFYRRIFFDNERIGQPTRMMDIRKAGALADHNRLSALGLRKNVKISISYLDTLNMTGRSDPLWTAGRIARVVNQAISCQRDIVRGVRYLGENEQIFLLPSNMQVGPCEVAKGLAKHPFTYGSAPILPLDRCSHPDQCACRYSLELYRHLSD